MTTLSIPELLEYWRFRNHRVQLAHYEASRRFERLHLWLGLPAIAISTIVGTTVFASLEKSWGTEGQIVVGLLSVVSAVLTGLQTFLRYAELGERHRVAGARFANLKHRLELVATLSSDDEKRASLKEIEDTWAKLREESPTLPDSIWRRIERQIKFGQPLYVTGGSTSA
jgi:hypothetical protein